MATNAEQAYELFNAAVGTTEGTGEWFEVTQDRIDQFAEITEDRQFIHVDPEMAAQLSPWKVTIAHGFLTLSMLTHLSGSIPQDMTRLSGIMMGVNYGFDKVRFVSPVKVGAKIRATAKVNAVTAMSAGHQLTMGFTIEIQGDDKPACVAETVVLLLA